jgi:GH35 family endo-1,4-beta-xylanase
MGRNVCRAVGLVFVVQVVVHAVLACSDSERGSPSSHAGAAGEDSAGAGAGQAGSAMAAGSAGMAQGGQGVGGSDGSAQAGMGDGGLASEGGQGGGSVERCSGGDDGTLACENARLLVGAAVNTDVLGEQEYAAVLASEFGYVTPENVMKWGPLQPTIDSWDFTKADQLLAFAEEHGQEVKGHALVWHVQQPAWASGLAAPALAAAVEAHIKQTVPHFKGRLRAWDVVNEAILDGGIGIRPGLHSALGVSGMADAFKWAREADPTAKLYYNDYGIELFNDKSDAVYRLMQDLLAAGAPLDGIGFQGHFSTKHYPSLLGLRANIKRFADLGLTVNVSELDVRTAEVATTKPQRLAAQAIAYREVAAACALEQACEAVTLWGFTDAYSWVDGEFGADDPLPWNETYEKKPAHAALLLGLAGQSTPTGAELVADGGCETGAGWTGFGGAMIAVVANGRTGNACRASARTQPYHGPAVSLTGKVPHGATVSARAYARVANAAGGRVRMILKKVEAGVADEYRELAGRVAPDADWVLLTANFTLGFATAPSELTLYVESPAIDAQLPNLLVDDLTVRVLNAN